MTIHPANPIGRAFSLIEVLIAILVLALGLLGLGAVFPAVIAEQRRSFDSISGESLAAAVQEQMRSDSEAFGFGRDRSITTTPGSPRAAIEKDGIWARHPDPRLNYWLFGLGNPRPSGQGGNTIDPVSPTNPAYTTNWIVSGGAAIGTNGENLEYIFPGYLANGRWTLNTLNSRPRFELPVASRVFPSPTSGDNPRLVWDPVFRRTPDGKVQVAIFVRRIDDRIRLNDGETLGDAILGLNRSRPVLPLALSIASGRLTTDDGVSSGVAYPEIMSLPAYTGGPGTDPSWLMLNVNVNDSNFNSTVEFLRRPGQTFVDSLGVVRRVVGTPTAARGQNADAAQRAIIVDPPFPRSQNPSQVPPRRDLQIIFTPQPPVAVRVFTLDRP